MLPIFSRQLSLCCTLSSMAVVDLSVYKKPGESYIVYDLSRSSFSCMFHLISDHKFAFSLLTYRPFHPADIVSYQCFHWCCLLSLTLCVIITAKWTEWMAEILFSFDVCLSVCQCVCVQRTGPVNSSKTLKATSNLTCMFPGTVRTWPLKDFSKRGCGQGYVTPKFLGVKC